MSYDNLRLTKKSLELYEACREIKERLLSSDYPELGQLYNNIGLLYYNSGDYLKGLEYCIKQKI